MRKETWETFDVHFGDLDDRRSTINRRHQLLDMMVIAICAVLCGADDWEGVAEFGRAKAKWFAGFLPLPSGIPSHDTFWRVFRQLDGEQFEACFLRWVAEVAELSDGEVVAIDGKSVRRSHDREAAQDAIVLVSAWATENRLTLGQVQVAEKSNEITAIPRLLTALDLTDCIVTIDAIGCQKEIAAQIVAAEADYVLALKQNHGRLYADVTFLFEDLCESEFTAFAYDSTQEVDKGHGRIEIRQCWTINDPTLFPICAAPWTGLLCIASSGYARNAFKTTIAALSTATSSPLCLVRPNSYSVPFALTGRSKMAVTGCLTSLSERMSPACAKAIARITSLSFAVSLSIFSNRIKRPSSASKTRDSRPPGITTISSCCFHSYSESSRLPWTRLRIYWKGVISIPNTYH